MSLRGCFLVALLFMFGCGGLVLAGNNANFGNQVGGVSISADGALGNTSLLDLKRLDESLAETLQGPSAKLKKPVELRKISLKAIEDALAANGQAPITALPEELKYLAGIQRIQYVLLYPETNDIVLAGPGEGWKLDG